MGAAHRRRGLPAAGRPAPPGRDRARRPGDLLAAGRPERPVRRRHHRRLDPDHRAVHHRGGQGPGGPHPRRRAAGAGRGHRAADRRPDPRCRGDRRQRQGGRHRRRPDRAVHHRRLPAARRARHDRARLLRPDLVRRAGRARRDPDAARSGRLRARDRHGDRRQRAGLRTSQGGVRRRAEEGAAGRAVDRVRQGVDARSSTPTSRPCWPPGCCSSWPPGRCAASA